MIQRKHRKTKKTSFLKETVEDVDLHKAILNKTMTTQQYCILYDFVAPLSFESKIVPKCLFKVTGIWPVVWFSWKKTSFPSLLGSD